MTKQTVVYYWNGSMKITGWHYIEVDYDHKIYSIGNTLTNKGLSKNVYLQSVPRYRDIKRHEEVLKSVGFTEIETFGGD